MVFETAWRVASWPVNELRLESWSVRSLWFGLICVIVVVWFDLCGCILSGLVTMSGFLPPFSELSGILSRDWYRASHMTWRVWQADDEKIFVTTRHTV